MFAATIVAPSPETIGLAGERKYYAVPLTLTMIVEIPGSAVGTRSRFGMQHEPGVVEAQFRDLLGTRR
jgi:hypothetical protein